MLQPPQSSDSVNSVEKLFQASALSEGEQTSGNATTDNAPLRAPRTPPDAPNTTDATANTILRMLESLAAIQTSDIPTGEAIQRIATLSLSLVPRLRSIDVYDQVEMTGNASDPSLRLLTHVSENTQRSELQSLTRLQQRGQYGRVALEELQGVQDENVSVIPLADTHGQLLGAIVVYLDERQSSTTTQALLTLISSAVSVLLERRAHGRREAQLAAQIEDEKHARDSFISLAAHELRSPLTAVKGYAQLLSRQARKTALPEAMMRSVESIEQQAARMSDMVGELHDASRIRRGSFEMMRSRHDLVALAQRVIERRQALDSQYAITLQTDAS